MIEHDLFQELTEIYSIARFLMAENPIRAELHYNILLDKQLNTLIREKTNIVVHYYIDNIAENEYIVFDNGESMTVKTIPERYKEWEIQRIDIITKNKDYELFKLFNSLCDKFESIHNEIYEKTEIPNIRKNISIYYEYKDNKYIKDSLISNALMKYPSSEVDSDETFNKWVLSCISKIQQDYNGLIIACDYFISVFSLFNLFRFSKKINWKDLFDDYLKFIRSEDMQGIFHENNWTIDESFNLASYEFEYYVTDKNQLDEAYEVACILFRHADLLKETALKQNTYQLFHKYLYEALLYYRCAMYVNDTILSVDCNFRHKNLIAQNSYMCEELRVQIELSIRPDILRNGIPNFGRSFSLFTWLSKYCTHNNSKQYEIASYYIHNWYQSLFYPNRIKKIALAYLEITNEPAIFEELSYEIERDFEEYYILGESDYLFDMYSILLDIYTKLQINDKINTYKLKLSADYLQNLIDANFNK